MSPHDDLFRASKKSILKLLAEAVGWLNQSLAKHGHEMRASVPTLSDEEVRELHPLSFKIFANEVESAVRMFVRPPEKIVNGFLGVMGGKSTASILFILMACMEFKLMGKNCTYLYVMPGLKSLQAQVSSVFTTIMPFLSRILFRKPGSKPVSFLAMQTQMNEEANGGPWLDNNILAMTRKQLSTAKGRRPIVTRIEEAEKNNWNLVLIWDEFHYGENKGGIADTCLRWYIKEFLRGDRPGSRMAVVSATSHLADAVNHLEPDLLSLCPLKAADDYVGYNFHNGSIIDPEVPIRTPHHHSFSSLQFAYRLPSLDMNPRHFKLTGSARDEFVTQFCKQIIHFYKNLGAEYYKKYYAGQKVSIGALVRVPGSTNNCKDVEAELRKQWPRLVIIPYHTEKQLPEALEQADKCSKANIPFLIIVCAQARMGAKFPCEIGVMMDFTRRYSTITAALQGIAGRAGNNEGKVRHVITTDINKEILDTLVSTLGIYDFGLPPHGRVKVDSNGSGRRQNPHALVVRNEGATRFIFEAINLVLGGHISEEMARMRSGRSPRGTYAHWCTEPILARLEGLFPGLQMLRPGENASWYDEASPYEVDKAGRVKLAIRDFEGVTVSDRPIKLPGGSIFHDYVIRDKKTQAHPAMRHDSKAGLQGTLFIDKNDGPMAIHFPCEQKPQGVQCVEQTLICKETSGWSGELK